MYQFNWRPVFDNFDLLLKGLLLGIGIAVLALAIGSIIGLLAGVRPRTRPASDAVAGRPAMSSWCATSRCC